MGVRMVTNECTTKNWSDVLTRIVIGLIDSEQNWFIANINSDDYETSFQIREKVPGKKRDNKYSRAGLVPEERKEDFYLIVKYDGSSHIYLLAEDGRKEDLTYAWNLLESYFYTKDLGVNNLVIVDIKKSFYEKGEIS